MPEPYWPKKGDYPLSRANENLQLVRVRCQYCKRQNIYQPVDLIQVYGDRDVDSLMLHMKCDSGDSHGNQDVKAFHPSGPELVGLKIRQLDASINVLIERDRRISTRKGVDAADIARLALRIWPFRPPFMRR